MAEHGGEIELDDSEDEGEQVQTKQKTAAEVAREQRIRKLQELQLKKNEAVNLNRKEVVEEDKRKQLPENWERKKRRVEWELEEERARQEAEARGEDYDRIKHLQITSLDAERVHEKEKKKAKQADQGFADYRQSTIRQYQKMTDQIKPDMNEYAREMVKKGDEVFYNAANTLTYGDQERADGDNVDRMVADLERQIQKRFKYTRRRAVHADADIDYINEANMKFNRKAERFYGEHTAEIKQSLERGTAL